MVETTKQVQGGTPRRFTNGQGPQQQFTKRYGGTCMGRC